MKAYFQNLFDHLTIRFLKDRFFCRKSPTYPPQSAPTIQSEQAYSKYETIIYYIQQHEKNVKKMQVEIIRLAVRSVFSSTPLSTIASWWHRGNLLSVKCQCLYKMHNFTLSKMHAMHTPKSESSAGDASVPSHWL